jgi:hypothetical protein
MFLVSILPEYKPPFLLLLGVDSRHEHARYTHHVIESTPLDRNFRICSQIDTAPNSSSFFLLRFSHHDDSQHPCLLGIELWLSRAVFFG